ncbi:MAG TPA: SdiA-regulated domain-containing protein [Polyangiaceae bacterium]|nr:SdiA-regulated domain-containing protein [Polyangiaceae bacterium]
MDRVAEFREYPPDFGSPRRIIRIMNGPVDAEGLTYIGSHAGLDRFALSIEASQDLVMIFDLAPDATSIDMRTAVLQTYEPAAAPAIANKGWEGVAFRPAHGGSAPRLYACQEGEPGQAPTRVLSFPYLPEAGTTLSYQNGSLSVDEPWNALDRLGSVAGDLSSVHYDQLTDTLLLLSHLGSRLLRVEPESGEIMDQLALNRSPQYEGVTLTSDGRLVLVSEPNFVEIFQRPDP